MKTIITVLALVATTGVFAQTTKEKEKSKSEVKSNKGEKERPSADERAAKLTDRMTKKLTLSADQSKQILEINKMIAAKNDALRTNKGLTKEERKSQFRGNHNTRIAMYKKVLTPEQMTQYEAWEKEKMEKRQEKKSEGKEKSKGNKETKENKTPESSEEESEGEL